MVRHLYWVRVTKDSIESISSYFDRDLTKVSCSKGDSVFMHLKIRPTPYCAFALVFSLLTSGCDGIDVNVIQDIDNSRTDLELANYVTPDDEMAATNIGEEPSGVDTVDENCGDGVLQNNELCDVDQSLGATQCSETCDELSEYSANVGDRICDADECMCFGGECDNPNCMSAPEDCGVAANFNGFITIENIDESSYLLNWGASQPEAPRVDYIMSNNVELTPLAPTLLPAGDSLISFTAHTSDNQDGFVRVIVNEIDSVTIRVRP